MPRTLRPLARTFTPNPPDTGATVVDHRLVGGDNELWAFRRIADGPADDPRDQLTERETEILKMVATGMSYKQIAARLVLSHRTVQNHVQNTLRKLQMNNRVQLTRWAIEHGLDEDPA